MKVYLQFLCSHFYIFVCLSLQSQGTWLPTPAPYGPLTGINNYGRYDDISFLNPEQGWAVNYNDSVVIRTRDGAQTWEVMGSPGGKYYRAVCFLDSLTGFIGKLVASKMSVSDTNIFYRTIDGGISWQAFRLPGPPDTTRGICGMYRVNDTTAVAVGRVGGPAAFYRTTDKGNTWTYKDMSAYAYGLIDCYFWTPDSGIVVGGKRDVSGLYDSSRAVILFTDDGGLTWANKATSAGKKAYCWKISFPGRKTGYVSIQQSGTFFKTMDGGQTWQELPYPPVGQSYQAQGIGFVNDTIGWIGGICCGASQNYMYRTENGGLNWVRDTIDLGINRFRFFGDSIGYCSGYRTIYKYTKNTPLSVNNLIKQNDVHFFPNPSSGRINIHIPELSIGKTTELVIYDINGKKVFESDNVQYPGINIQLNLQKGVYFYLLKLDQKFFDSGKFIIID